MSELKEMIHDEATGIDYILTGDYYVPVIELAQEPESIPSKIVGVAFCHPLCILNRFIPDKTIC